jgi:hypothetical protein
LILGVAVVASKNVIGVGPWKPINIIEHSFKNGHHLGVCNDVFGGKKKDIGVTCGPGQKTLHLRTSLAYHTYMPQAGVPA